LVEGKQREKKREKKRELRANRGRGDERRDYKNYICTLALLQGAGLGSGPERPGRG
jgi:hypothetical protein